MGSRRWRWPHRPWSCRRRTVRRRLLRRPASAGGEPGGGEAFFDCATDLSPPRSSSSLPARSTAGQRLGARALRRRATGRAPGGSGRLATARVWIGTRESGWLAIWCSSWASSARAVLARPPEVRSSATHRSARPNGMTRAPSSYKKPRASNTIYIYISTTIKKTP
jgi:hypothetical protein